MTEQHPSPSLLPAAGWFPDPEVSGQLRYWDGSEWTEHRAPQFAAPDAAKTPRAQKLKRPRRRIPRSTWVVVPLLLLFMLAGSSSGLPGVLVFLGLVGLITGLYALVSGRRSWALIPSRRIGAIVVAASLVTVLAGGALVEPGDRELALAETASSSTPTPAAAATATPTPTAPPTPTASPKPSSTPTARPAHGPAAAASGTTALDMLAALPVKGRAPKTGYDRAGSFGTAWFDVDRNGCDTRNDILARDLANIDRPNGCRVIAGQLEDPYTGTTIHFVRGNTSSQAVQIDHVVALLNAWQTGAQALTPDVRRAFANDPLNLLAVDGPANAQKGAGDAATWLPRNKGFRCEYAARQVSVKAAYGLWVTQAEHDALGRVLGSCDAQPGYLSTLAPSLPPALPAPSPDVPAEAPAEPLEVAPAPPTAPQPAPAPELAPAPAPAPPPAPAPAPAPEPAPAPAPSTVHPGSFCSAEGATGVTKTGKAMVCITTAEDDRLRWRSAG